MKLVTKSILFASILVLVLQSCSRKKDTFLSRNFHALNTKYNILFNGYVALEKGQQTVNNAYKDNYWEILPVERMQVEEDIFLPGQEAKNEDFKRAEEKAVKAVQKHGMNIDGKEKNPQIDEAYLLLGKARYFDQRFIPALEAFNYILYKYPKSDKINHAKIWREKTNIRLENEEVAIENLKRLLEQEELEDQDLADATSMLAQAFINIKHLDSALVQMKIASAHTKKNFEKGRFNFIKGQLYNALQFKDSANMAFDKVIDLNRKIPRKYLIGAYIEKAKNFDYDNEDKLAFLELLTDLEENRENRPFLDKILYQKGEYYKQIGLDSSAKAFYNKSLRQQSQDKQLRANTYQILAEYSFEEANYKTSGAYYDSTMNNLVKNSKPYRVIKRKRENLDDVILYEGIANTNDSILNLVNMSDDKRLQYFTNYTDSLKQIALLQQQKEDIEAIKKQLNSNTTIGTPFVKNASDSRNKSTFYFYNENTIALGKQEFQRVWGNRKNVDNWRWESLKTAGTNNAVIANNNNVVNEDSLKLYRPEFYIAKIPTDSNVIDSLKTERNYAYYQLGLIYKEKFKEYQLSKNRFQDLLESNPEEKLVLPSKYNLYKINEILNEASQMAFYKNDIVSNYPESRYAKLLLNPNASDLDKESPDYLYAQTYRLLESQDYQEVIDKTNKYLIFFGEDDIAPKFQLLQATAVGRLKGYNAYKQALSNIATDYANTKEGEQATKLLTGLTQIQDTSFVEAKDSKSFKAIYTFKAEEFGEIANFKTSLNKAIKNIPFYDLTLSEDLYDANTTFVVVHGITSQQGAESFDALLKDNNTRTRKAEKAFKIKRTSIGISTKNYQTVQIHKKFNSYLEDLK